VLLVFKPIESTGKGDLNSVQINAEIVANLMLLQAGVMAKHHVWNQINVNIKACRISLPWL